MYSAKPICTRGVLGEAGMTLVEVLVATAITAVVLLTCFGLYSGVKQRQQRLEDRSALLHQTRVFTQRLAVELRSLASVGDGLELRIEPDLEGNPLLTFTTLATTEENNQGAAQVRYQLDRQKADDTYFSLQRGEAAAYLQQASLEMRPFLENVSELQWQVFDGAQWHSLWKAGSPLTLRITMSLNRGEESFSVDTAFDLSGGGSP